MICWNADCDASGDGPIAWPGGLWTMFFGEGDRPRFGSGRTGRRIARPQARPPIGPWKRCSARSDSLRRKTCARGFSVPSNSSSAVCSALEQCQPPPSTLLLADWATRMGQDLFYPPNVGGWPEGRSWLSFAGVIARANFAAALVEGRLWNSDYQPDLRRARAAIARPPVWINPSSGLPN